MPVFDGGTARCWGFNGNGELGDGTTTDSSTPVVVSGLAGAAALTAGNGHTCARLDDGTARCWGLNGYGELGDGTTTNSSTPVTVVTVGVPGTIVQVAVRRRPQLRPVPERCRGLLGVQLRSAR